ncbi:MAG: nucleotidyl transferase AbiEii/AbiGii toxin family protein [Solirubrobacteraceae bacterium]
MSASRRLEGLAEKIVAVDELLESMGVLHQFGGAIALAWYRRPRATTDIDLNVTVAPEAAEPVLGALGHLGVTITDSDRDLIARDGQVRLDWLGSWLDLFFATLELHEEMATDARIVDFGSRRIPILSPEHLIVCKAIFNRPKDWVDIEEIVGWGTDVDRETVRRWVEDLLGKDAQERRRLLSLLPRSS